MSKTSGQATACEISKKCIERKIMGTDYPEGNLDYNEEDESDHRHIEEQRNLLSQYGDECDGNTTLGAWLKEIKDEVDITVQEGDDGDRDNIMLNKAFAEHFMRLCKLLPLWCGISCPVFGSSEVTSSSANVESYIKDVKHTLKDIIPATADIFLQHHMDGINDSIIVASQKYAKMIDLNIAEIRKEPQDSAASDKPAIHDDDSEFEARQQLADCSLSDEEDRNANDNAEDEEHNTKSNDKHSDSCIACSQGNFPTGAHTCVKCHKNVHVLPGCSYSFGSEEGYGSKQICASCHLGEQSQNAKEMNFLETWKPKKSRTKRSVYLQKNPAFNLMSATKKTKIGLVKNAEQSQTTKRVKGQTIYLSNTCAFDSLAHALAGAYAYYPIYRRSMDQYQSDAMMEIAISLAKKYEFLSLILLKCVMKFLISAKT